MARSRYAAIYSYRQGSKQFLIGLCFICKSHMRIRLFCELSSARSSFQEAYLQKKRLHDVDYGIRFFIHGGRDRLYAHGPSVERFMYDLYNFPIDVVEPHPVYTVSFKRLFGGILAGGSSGAAPDCSS